MSKSSLLLSLFVFWILLFSKAFAAQESGAALSLRIAVCKRAFAYEKTLCKLDEIRVAVLHNDNEQGTRLTSEFDEPGKISAEMISLEALQENPENYHVVYFEEGIDDVDTIRKILSEHNILSLTSSKNVVEAGEASLGVFFEDGKVSILINEQSIKSEEKKFFGEILSLAKVLR